MTLSATSLLANFAFFAAMIGGLLLCLLPTSSWLNRWMRLHWSVDPAGEWLAASSEQTRDHA